MLNLTDFIEDLRSRLRGNVLEAKIVGAATDLHHSVTDTVGAQSYIILENATVLDRADNVLNPNWTLRNGATVDFLRCR